jgi:threonine dehydratase
MKSGGPSDLSSAIKTFAREVEKAYARIGAVVLRTPTELVSPFSRGSDQEVHAKWECDQITGSFKLRGALNKVRTLTAAERRKGVVSASTGNHGLAVNHAAKLEGVGLTLFLPENASPKKIALLRAAGADLRFFGTDCERTEVHARGEAEASGRIYISPYNDIDIIHGAGTIGIEILDAVPEADAVVVPIGGGGLIAGIGGYLKAVRPSVRIVGVEPSVSAFMKASFAAGRLVNIRERPTAADAVAGGIEPGAITFPLCRKFVDEILTVSEMDLARALLEIRNETGRTVEGAGALALAALRRHSNRFQGMRIVLVASGKNIAPETFQAVVSLAKRN